jgi:hypothetical protein
VESVAHYGTLRRLSNPREVLNDNSRALQLANHRKFFVGIEVTFSGVPSKKLSGARYSITERRKSRLHRAATRRPNFTEGVIEALQQKDHAVLAGEKATQRLLGNPQLDRGRGGGGGSQARWIAYVPGYRSRADGRQVVLCALALK